MQGAGGGGSVGAGVVVGAGVAVSDGGTTEGCASMAEISGVAPALQPAKISDIKNDTAMVESEVRFMMLLDSFRELK